MHHHVDGEEVNRGVRIRCTIIEDLGEGLTSVDCGCCM